MDQGPHFDRLFKARPMYYILKTDKQPVEADVLTWGVFFENDANRRVAHTFLGLSEISTVFLGLDHNWGDGPPLIFETMIFGGRHDGYQTRCSTWEEAEAGHREAVSLLGDGLLKRLLGRFFGEWWHGWRRRRARRRLQKSWTAVLVERARDERAREEKRRS